MTAEMAVKMIDSTAKFYIWSDGPCGWVKGSGWETKIMANEDRAWDEASNILASFTPKPAYDAVAVQAVLDAAPVEGRVGIEDALRIIAALRGVRS